MRNYLAAFLLFCAALSLGACSIWKEHPVKNWTDATGGEGLERSFWQDVKDKNWDELERHVSSTYTSINIEGDRWDRKQLLDHLRQLQLVDYSLGDFQVELQGNTAIVTYTATLHGTLAQQPLPTQPVSMMTVWQQQKKGWMAIAHSSSGPRTPANDQTK